MSDGTLKILFLATLLETTQPISFLGLDEPELNLHPGWLRVVARWLQTAKRAEQIFVSTHSPDLLDSFTEGFRSGDVKLLVFDTRDGPHVRAVHPADLDSFFQEGWELGDLYRVGEPQLGGWPW